MMGAMYQSTVFDEEVEPPSTARVARDDEPTEALACQSRRLGNMGVKMIVFQDEQMMATWRLRIAALAK